MKEKRNLLIGIFISVILGWTLGFLRLPYIENNFSFWMGFLAALSLIFLIAVTSLVWKKNSTSKGIQNAPRNYTLIWLIVSALLLVGSLLSSFSFFKQNDFYKNQVQSQQQKIEKQSELLASNKFRNSIVIMNNVSNEINEELKKNTQRILSNELISKIAALNYAFQPYPNLEQDSLLEKNLSPERGQLLLLLSAMNIDSSSFNKIKMKTSFSGADLEGADLKGVDLSGVDLMDANLKDAVLRGANLTKANLTNSSLWGCKLNKANLSNAILKYADLRWAELDSANLSETNLYGVDLRDAKMRNANAEAVNLEWAKLSGAFLNKTNLTKSKMAGADFSRANLSEANLSKSNLKLGDLSEAVLTKANLTEMQLFNVGVSTNDWLDKLDEWQVIGAKEVKENHKIVDDISKEYNYRIKNK